MRDEHSTHCQNSDNQNTPNMIRSLLRKNRRTIPCFWMMPGNNTMLTIVLVFSIFIFFPSTLASEVDDRCSKEVQCEPSDVDSFFCDYQIGPTAGGYCVACEGRQTYFCGSDETGLTEAGALDCEDKCSMKQCLEPCAEGYFCSLFNFQDGPCQACETLIVHPEECHIYGFPEAGLKACMDTCPPKSCSKRRHCLSNDASVKYFCDFNAEKADDDDEVMGTCQPCAGLKSISECGSRSTFGVQECEEVCEDVVLTSCSTNDDCIKDRFFCNYNSSICEGCPSVDSIPDWHVQDCFNVTKFGLVDIATQRNCAESCTQECNDEKEGFLSFEGLTDIGKDDNIPMKGTPYSLVSGPLVDCQFGGAGECLNDAELENFICLASRGVRKFSDKALNCEESGGIGTIMYNNEENGEIVEGTVGDAPVEFPITAISLQKGQYLLENGLGLNTTVEVKLTGEECDRGCSDSIPCPTSPGSWYCDYKLVTHGYCQECDSNEDLQRNECFFSGLSLKGAQTCSATCESKLTSPSCKFCGQGISGDGLQSVSPGEETCNFCPDGLKKDFFEREIPFIGSNATCYKLNQFFLNYEIGKNDPNCQLALGFNYICDCEGPGYAGADSDKKRKALVWAPRVSGIISFFSSAAIILDVVRDKKKRGKLYCQLVATMSIFDLMGSAAYSLTTLPIPQEYHIEGSKGNEATCTAQGFFIQMGTISAFVNVSLAVYYYFFIKLRWTETMMEMNLSRWLFICPITVGLIFAFAGIPFYDMLFLWCNNGAAWWPDLPVAVGEVYYFATFLCFIVALKLTFWLSCDLKSSHQFYEAIIFTTCTMISICWFVYKTEKKSREYTSDPQRQSMTTSVFWQSIWYLLSFYLTWPPYLSLQYLWAAGKGYNSFGYILFASTLVPLQGFWNCVVFFRVRTKKKVAYAISQVSSGVSRIQHSRFLSHEHKGSAVSESAIGQEIMKASPWNKVPSASHGASKRILVIDEKEIGGDNENCDESSAAERQHEVTFLDSELDGTALKNGSAAVGCENLDMDDVHVNSDNCDQNPDVER